MAVRKVLEVDGSYTGSILRMTNPKGVKVNVSLLCECNEEYSIQEKFKGVNDTVTRSTECPGCNDKTFLTYELKTTETESGLTGDVNIKPKATAIRSKMLKQEDIDIELLYK